MMAMERSPFEYGRRSSAPPIERRMVAHPRHRPPDARSALKSLLEIAEPDRRSRGPRGRVRREDVSSRPVRGRRDPVRAAFAKPASKTGRRRVPKGMRSCMRTVGAMIFVIFWFSAAAAG
jgi:hypothetical protein